MISFSALFDFSIFSALGNFSLNFPSHFSDVLDLLVISVLKKHQFHLDFTSPGLLPSFAELLQRPACRGCGLGSAVRGARLGHLGTAGGATRHRMGTRGTMEKV